jgi:hypothetical protein
MVMCSDFSLKALIGSWDEKLLGPNPFEQSGETSKRKICLSSQERRVSEKNV